MSRYQTLGLNLLLTLPFILLFWLNLAHHELWLDELNAWGISAASPTLKALFANVHYEGHPWLWYFILWIPSRLTHAPVAMKWVEAFIGAAIYLVIGLLSPFTRLQKILIFLNYFVAFEYTVLSRPYGVMFLLTLLYARRRAAKPRAFIGNLVLLGALANTDMTGIVLSGALLIEYAFSQLPQWREIEQRRALSAFLLYMSMLLFSVHSLLPAPDISWETTGHMFAKAGSFKHLSHSVANLLVASWWPFASGYPHQFWNTDVDFNRSEVVFVPFVLAGLYWIFRRRHNLLLLIGTTLIFGISFAHLIYLGYARHWGVGVVAFLIALWILCYNRADRQTISRVAYFFLLIAAIKGVAAIAASWTHPFSETANVAQWLRDHHLDREPIAGTLDIGLAGVAEQLERPVYFLDCDCVDTYMKFSHRRDGLKPEQVPERILHAYDSLHAQRLVLIMDYQLSPKQMDQLAASGFRAQPLTQFTGSEDRIDFYLYQVGKSVSQ
ncbi:MAG: hypothetical protein ACR2JE_12725 [Acidobacteriaceae bacterium]